MGCIVPAILTDNLVELERMIEKAQSFISRVQIDIMDGLFVPTKSVTCLQIKEINIPLDWEVHLMVAHPLEYLQCFKQAGATKIIFHYEMEDNPEEVIIQARKLNLGVGLAVNPSTPLEHFVKLVDGLDSVLFLSVNPGYYGSKLIPEILDKIKEFRCLKPGVETGIDGGINAGNITNVVRCGVDKICVGSAIFLSDNAAVSYRRLEKLASQTT
jgi:ribulose-phosphate 3-epimerase